MRNPAKAPPGAPGVMPPADLATKARELVLRVGLRAACERTGLAKEAITRLAAGLPMRRGSIALAREGLRAPTNDNPPPRAA
jgi:hypothetical protein